MLLQDLKEKKLIDPPSWLINNTAYLTIMGSHAYGTADTTSDKVSDFDIYGFCVPPKEMIFPTDEIPGFGEPRQKFEQFQNHHVFDKDAVDGKGREYDFTVFSIIKYFNLVMAGNPNCIDAIYTPFNCVIHSTEIGNMVRENRKLFLHKGCYQKFKGYAYSQMNKMSSKNPVGNRKELREKYGYDCKFALHLVRLLGECEQILAEGDLDLQRNNEQLKAIRRGQMGEAEVKRWASDKEKQLEQLYVDSKLPWGPDHEKIKSLLLRCLEHHYGSLDKLIVMPDRYKNALQGIRKILDENGIH